MPVWSGVGVRRVEVRVLMRGIAGRLLRRGRRLMIGVGLVVLLGFPVAGVGVLCGSTSVRAVGAVWGLSKIKHIVVINQENRSFDSYFGTFPGADGIPMVNGTPTSCLPDPVHGGCVRPYVDHHNVNLGGPHSRWSEISDVDQGKMDG